jgi:hypothetical protein
MGERSPNPLESALAHLRGGYAASPGNEESGWFTRLEFEEHSLLEWARGFGCLGDEHELIRSGPADGVEHRVLFDEPSGRWFKATHPETYGGAPAISYDLDPVTNRPVNGLVLGKATPLQYLERWRLFNAVFGDDVRLERVLKVGYGLSIVVSQRDITGAAPELDEIVEYFAARGFQPLPHSQDAYYRADDDLIAMDAHQANLVLTAEGIVPIDIPVFRGSADRDIAKWLRGVIA